MNAKSRKKPLFLASLFAVTLALTGCSSITSLVGASTQAPAARDTETDEYSESGRANVFQLKVGDCFNDTPGSEISDLTVVPCGEAHDNEIYYSFSLPDGDWPGKDAVDELADAGCLEQFEPFIGTTYDESLYYFFPITPLQDGWTEVGDREVLCAAYDSGPIKGSLAGVSR